jgi:glycosyltransferase involved in cell wall biosynthesis
MPTVVDLDRYPVGNDRVRHDVFTVGWIGSPSTTRYLNEVQPALSTLSEGGKARLLLVGAEHISLDGVPIESRRWTEASEVQDVHDFDVGIMPLTDDPWSRGKCGYKLIQYMACGLPVIASPVGINNQIVEQGVNGFLAQTPDDWLHALTTLRDDVKLRARLGAAGRAKVEAQYTLQVTAPRLLTLLHEAAGC